MTKSAGFAKHPDYKIDISTFDRPVEVWKDGIRICRTERALEMREGNYDPVFYIPARDCQSVYRHRTDHQTYCPFKGYASYWTLKTGESEEENVIWGYEDPYEEVAEIRDHLAFYSDRVEIRII